MCSIPIAWNAVIGNQQARILPGTLLLTSAIVTPKHTNQLATIPRKNASIHPVVPNAAYFVITFALLTAIIFAATAAHPLPPAAAARGATVPALVRLIASNIDTTAHPIKFPVHTQVQLRKVCLQLQLPAHVAIGSRAKLPVTSSIPNSTILANPKGNNTDPKKGNPD